MVEAKKIRNMRENSERWVSLDKDRDLWSKMEKLVVWTYLNHLKLWKVGELGQGQGIRIRDAKIGRQVGGLNLRNHLKLWKVGGLDKDRELDSEMENMEARVDIS